LKSRVPLTRELVRVKIGQLAKAGVSIAVLGPEGASPSPGYSPTKSTLSGDRQLPRHPLRSPKKKCLAPQKGKALPTGTFETLEVRVCLFWSGKRKGRGRDVERRLLGPPSEIRARSDLEWRR
jgi:hypothetical protein